MQSVNFNHASRILVDIDLDEVGRFEPLVQVQPGRGAFKTAILQVQAATDDKSAAHPSPPFVWLDASGEPVDKEITVAIGSAATLAVDTAWLSKRVNSTLARKESGIATMDLDPVITRIINRNQAHPSGESLKIRANLRKQPQAPAVSLLTNPVDIDDREPGPDGHDRLRVGSIELRFEPDVGLAEPGREFLAEISCPDETGAAVYMECAPACQGLLHVIQVSEEGGGVTYSVKLADPQGLSMADTAVLNLYAMYDELVERLPEIPPASGRSHFAERSQRIQLNLAWADDFDDQGYLREWQDIENSPDVIRVRCDTRQWVAVTFANKHQRVLLDGSQPVIGLSGIELSLPARSSGDLLGWSTNERLAFSTNASLVSPAEIQLSLKVMLPGVSQDADNGQLVFQSAAPMRLELRDERGLQAADTYLDMFEFAEALDAMVAQYGAARLDGRHLDCVVEAKLWSRTDGISLELPDLNFTIALVREHRNWPICIDIGTSATAIWVGASAPGGVDDFSITPLELGAWHEKIDRLHDESPAMTGNEASKYLIPSHIGLSSQQNLRARYNPLSLGDLELALDTPPAIERRLRRFSRRYDVSAPFPNSSEMHKFADTIVFDLKRALTLGERTIAMSSSVHQLDPDSATLDRDNRVEVQDLLADYIDELLRLYISRSVHESLMEQGRHLDEALLRPRLIVTHPAGIGTEQAEFYRRATAKAVSRVAKFLPLPIGRPGSAQDTVILYPESVAAARFALWAMSDEEDSNSLSLPIGTSTIVALDIGAGTYDVTIMEVTRAHRQASPEVKIVQNFGIPLAGDRLDEMIIQHLISIIEYIFTSTDLARSFRLDLRSDSMARRLADVPGERRQQFFWFRRQVKAAKARLTEALLRQAADQETNYVWDMPPQAPHASRSDPAGREVPQFKLLLFDAETRDGIVQPHNQQSSKSLSSSVELTIGGVKVELQVEGWQDEGGGGGSGLSKLWLLLGPDAFRSELLDQLWPGTARKAARLDDAIEALGRVIPEIALEAAAQSGGERPGFVVATGRTTLWPQLYESISRTIAGSSHGFVLGNKLPFDPMKLKQAVVAGARLLTREKAPRDVEPIHANPVAIVELTTTPEFGGSGGHQIHERTRIASIRYVTGPDVEESGPQDFAIAGRFTFARALPGLTPERLEAINKVLDDAAPCIILQGAKQINPADLGAGSNTSWRVTTNAAGKDGKDVEIRMEASGQPTSLHLVISGDAITKYEQHRD